MEMVMPALKAALPLVVAPMFHLARSWAQRRGWPSDSYIVVTNYGRLRGYHPDTPIHVIDTTVRFEDIRVVELINTRFNNVQRYRL